HIKEFLKLALLAMRRELTGMCPPKSLFKVRASGGLATPRSGRNVLGGLARYAMSTKPIHNILARVVNVEL
ncbi:MAG: hypothetical protein AAFR23_09120, partial [Pseudomonadota bacterium]